MNRRSLFLFLGGAAAAAGMDTRPAWRNYWAQPWGAPRYRSTERMAFGFTDVRALTDDPNVQRRLLAERGEDKMDTYLMTDWGGAL